MNWQYVESNTTKIKGRSGCLHRFQNLIAKNMKCALVIIKILQILLLAVARTILPLPYRLASSKAKNGTLSMTENLNFYN